MDELFQIFDEIGLPYFRQGSLSDEEYPPTFFTFWNIDSPNIQVRDNETRSHSYYVSVGFYTNNADLIYTQLERGGEFNKKARARGFIIEGNPYDTDSGKKDYYGRILFVRIVKRLEANQ
jgi:hypothetical protein